MMKKIDFGFLFPGVTLIILIATFSRSVFGVPALGKFLNPFIGAMQNEKANPASQRIALGGKGETSVFFDDRRIPHVFAQNDADLYAAQGYVVASDRLWQMDFISYVAAGRLAEIFGKVSPQGTNFLIMDRGQRRKGLLHAAKASLALMEQDPLTKTALDNYTRGVNRYIASLTYKTLPFEYKLLGYVPEPWTNLKSALILKYMADQLSNNEEDVYQTQLKLSLGNKDFSTLYPDYTSYTATLTGDNRAIKTDSFPFCNYINYSFLNTSPVIKNNPFDRKLASNCWVVSGAKTKSGNPILSNDPHLGLTLPAIWYEMQLVADTMNVYGVSIPGTPGIIIGFNKDVAWGVTNGATDVKDWYKIKLKEDFSAYEMDGHWVATTRRVDTLLSLGGNPFYDTVYSTVHGPIVIDSTVKTDPAYLNYALKWTLHKPSNEFRTFLLLNRARTYNDYVNAIQHYRSPVQNFLFASVNGDIAENHQGDLYKKNPGQGKFILDGSRKDHIYDALIPQTELPQQFNPATGYLYSANNRPDESGFPYYLNGYYAETRANGIRRALDTMTNITVQDMQKMQLDNTNQFAKAALPLFLNSIRPVLAQDSMFKTLAAWDCRYNASDTLPWMFERWWLEIQQLTWDELRQYPFYNRPPEGYVFLSLLQKDSANAFFDIIGTDKRETATDILQATFQSAKANFASRWAKTWGDYHKIAIGHFTGTPALSRVGIASPGHADALNAITPAWGANPAWGPSWRMVVELGDRPNAYGIYNGGQSGNPASPAYDQFVNDWLVGKYFKLNFFLTPAEAQQTAANQWTLK
jgi:penicillin G amidase